MNQNETYPFIPALGYDFLTAYYDVVIKITMPEKKFRGILVEHINPSVNEHILEFGFGTCQNLLLLLKTNPNITLKGVDIDPKVVTIAENKLRKHEIKIPLQLYDGRTLPYADGSFDKVYSCLVFHQLDMDTKISSLSELNRILKPNGELVIADWGKASNWLMRLSFCLVQLLDGFKTTNDNVKGLMPDIISKAGFVNVDIVNSFNTAIGTISYFKATKK